MNEYSLFGISTICGSVIGLSAFRLLFRELADLIPIYQRIACAIGGAFLGTFAGALMSAAFPALTIWPRDYLVTFVLASAMSVGIQKFVGEQN